jgi:hypothetical protein
MIVHRLDCCCELLAEHIQDGVIHYDPHKPAFFMIESDGPMSFCPFCGDTIVYQIPEDKGEVRPC